MRWVKSWCYFSLLFEKGKRINDLEVSIGDLMQEMDAGQKDAVKGIG